jgi:hypothetical protein
MVKVCAHAAKYMWILVFLWALFLCFLSNLCLVGGLMGGAKNCNDGFVPRSEDCCVSIVIGQYWAFKEGCGGKS